MTGPTVEGDEPYYRLRKLTVDARGTLAEFMRYSSEVVAEGVDLSGRLVFRFKDANGWKGPFALVATGRVTDPIEPVVPLALEDVPPDDQDVLYGILEEG